VSASAHVLIPFAACESPASRQALAALALPQLSRLLSRLSPQALDAGHTHDLCLPHERVLARALGLWRGDGRVPWAAWDLRQQGGAPAALAWAWLTPCHWQVGRDRVVMAQPAALQLSEADSREMLEAMTPYFEEDGLALEWVAPLRWRARGEVFRDLSCASLERAAGATVDDWLPRAQEARTVRRLQQEMQMLLYTHPVNARREAQGLTPVNSFWVGGAGALPADLAAQPPAARSPLQADDRLREPALAHDWPSWAAAWQQLDAQVLAPLSQAADRGERIQLTLCGEKSARTWAFEPVPWHRRLMRALRPAPALAQALDPL
jgi:hypothetical protein